MRLLVVAASALVASLVTACGGRAIDTIPIGSDDAGTHDASDASSCGPAPGWSCGTTCDGVPLAPPACVDGSWQCNGPTIKCVDAGTCGPMPDIACAIGCSGEVGPPDCVNGSWQCPPVPPCVPPPPDAGFDAGTFACGSLTCDANRSFCQISEGGAQLPDGGGNVSAACVPLPSTCDGSAPATCACVQALQGVGVCPCKGDADGKVTIVCEYP